MKPVVSLIIANWNGGEVMKNCLSSLSSIDYPNWELIIVDNGSGDGSEQYVKKFNKLKGRFTLVKNRTNLGFAKANNQGYEKSEGKYILLLNNDTKVPADFLSKMINKMEEDKSIGLMQPKIFMMDKEGYLDNAGSFMTDIGFLQHWGFLCHDGEEFNKEREIFSAKGACILIRRQVIERVGLFDEKFFSYFEESDFCWRVWLAGYRIIYYPKAHIYHKVGFTIKRLNVFNINYHYYKNRISSLIKNLELGNLLRILPVHIIISLGIAMIFLLRGQPKNSFMIFKSILWIISNLPEILQKRAMVQKIRTVSDRKLFDKLMRPVNWKQYFNDFERIEADLRKK